VAPDIRISNLAEPPAKQPTKQERMKLVREANQTKFEEMRLKARNVVKSKGTASSVVPMGPIKSFGELQDSIMKMRENFDFTMLGKVAKQTLGHPPH
jgi:hypothetical protein